MGACEQQNMNYTHITNLAVMDWGKVCLRCAVAAPNLKRVSVIVPFALWNLRIEGRDIQLLALSSRVTSEACGVQTYWIKCVRHTVEQAGSGQPPHWS